MTKRIEWIDAAKGLLIILVVLGHSEVNIVGQMLINSFHMAAFFFLSGLTFSYKDDVSAFYKKKVKGLLIPYLAFCSILLLYQFVKTLVLKGTTFDLASGLVSIVIPISGRMSTTTYGLWFLPCLFIAEVVSYFFLKNITKRKALSMLALTILCCICIFTYIVSEIASVLSVLPIALLFLLLGFGFKKVISKIKQKSIIVFIITSCMFLVCVGSNWLIAKQTVDLSSMSLGFWPLYLLSSFFGTVAVCTVAIKVSQCKCIQNLGRDSLYYYGLHYEVIGIIDKIFGGILQTVVTFAVLIPVVILYKKMKVVVMERN